MTGLYLQWAHYEAPGLLWQITPADAHDGRFGFNRILMPTSMKIPDWVKPESLESYSQVVQCQIPFPPHKQAHGHRFRVLHHLQRERGEWFSQLITHRHQPSEGHGVCVPGGSLCRPIKASVFDPTYTCASLCFYFFFFALKGIWKKKHLQRDLITSSPLFSHPLPPPPPPSLFILHTWVSWHKVLRLHATPPTCTIPTPFFFLLQPQK